MTAASVVHVSLKAKVVIGFPGAGPTCFTITLFASCSSWVRGAIRLECPASGGLGDQGEGSLVVPDSPDDAGQLVGYGHRSLVVHVSLGEVVRPLP